MRKAFAAALLLSLALAGPVAAAGTIAANGTPQYQHVTTFAITLTGQDAHFDCSSQYNSGKCARVEVLCYQATDASGFAQYDNGPTGGETLGYGYRVYGEAGNLDMAEYTGFTLGGTGLSPWILDGGGPAECIANLFRFATVQGQQTYIEIATTSFHTNG